MTSGAAQTPQFALPPLPELRSVKVFGRNIRYYDFGSGQALVLIHGIGGDADDWAFCLHALSASHRVIALDLLGFGRSDKPLIDYSIAGFVELLERFLRTLDIKRATLIGGSLGGWIAAAFALQFADVVDRLGPRRHSRRLGRHGGFAGGSSRFQPRSHARGVRAIVPRQDPGDGQPH